MKLKFELEMERIFSYAMGLEQSGRQKNMIFCLEDMVYILNSDKTIILRFQASKKEFPEPVGFFASSYDSSEFGTHKGFITFLKESQEFVRKKLCKVPSQTFEEVEELYFRFHNEDNVYVADISFSKPSLDLLEESLSHIEFLSQDKELKILQRDIYSGTLIELERKKATGLGLSLYEDDIGEDFGPLGMRTNDFFSLFNFNDKIKIFFLSPDKDFFIIEGSHNSMTGVVAGCLYDEIGVINDLQEEKTHGREKSKDRNSVKEIDRTAEKKVLLCRKRK